MACNRERMAKKKNKKKQASSTRSVETTALRPETNPNLTITSLEEPIQGEVWLPWVFGILTAVVFLMTMCRTVPGGDSGELISVSYALGVAHPPGYPLYTLLGHLFTYIPIGNVAWRVNFMSAVFGLASGLVLYALTARWLRDRWLAILAAGIFIFSPLAWRYAVVAEVFTLNNLFIVLLLYVTLRFVEEPRLKWAAAWSATLGLACSHHHTILFLAIPIFLMLVWRHHKLLLEPKVLLICTGLFAIGFLPYVYIVFAAQKNLLISWGRTDTWDGFWTHFLRREYGTFQLATGDTKALNVFNNLKYYGLDMWLQFLWVGIPIAVYGIWYFLKIERKNPFAQLLLVGWLFYVVVFHELANMDLSNRLFYDVQSRFWLLPNIILALMLAAGAKVLLSQIPERKDFVRALIVSLALGIQIGYHYEREDHSKNTVFYDLGKSLLDGLPPNALAFMRGDVYVNSVRYMQAVEGYRTDVKSIPFDLLWWPWMRGLVEANFPELRWPGKIYRYRRANLGEFTLKDFYDLNFGIQPSFIGKLADHEIANLAPKYTLVPVGFLNRLALKDQPFDAATFKKDVEGFSGFHVPGKSEIREKSWEAFIYYNYWDRELEKSKVAFEEGTRNQENPELLLLGVEILERMSQEYPEVPPSAYRNLGVAYQLLAKKNMSYIPKMVEAWRKYLNFNPTNDPQIEQIRRAVAGGAVISIPPGRLNQSPPMAPPAPPSHY